MVERHGFPPIPTQRWVDLRATASSFALPRSLDKALAALGLPIEKDKAGQRLVRSLSRLDRKTGAYPELTPAIVERVAAYNRIDIVALEAMRGQGLGRLSAAEQAVWELDQRINARGIAIDVGFVEAAKRIADQVMGEAIAEFAQLTEGYFALSGAEDPRLAEGPQMRLAQSRQRDGQRRARARRAPRRRAAGAGDPADHRRDQPEEARRHARLRRRRRPGPWPSAVSRRRHRAMVRAIDPAAELSAADARGGRRSRGTGGRGQDRRSRAATLLGQADRRAGLRIAPCADRG